MLALVAVLVGGAYYWFDVRGREAREAAARVERRLVDFDPERVREITIDTGGEQVIVRAGAHGWRITAPVDERADLPVVEGLLSFIQGLDKVRSLDGLGDLAAVGLDRPAARLGLALDGGERLTLLVGGPNPARTGVYAAVEGVPAIFLAPSSLGAELAKRPYVDELRDRAILPVDPERVTRIVIARHDARIAVERVDGRRWQVEGPFSGPGDDGIIRDLLWKIGSSRAHRVIREPGPLADYGLDRPHARLTVTEDGGPSRTLAVTQTADDPQRVYAQVDAGPAVHVTDGQLLADLAIRPDLLRNRQLLVYDQRDVERITIRYPGDTLVLHREGEDWRVTKPVEGDARRTVVENILEVLPNLRYATVDPRPGDLRRYGLEPPRAEVTVGLKGGRELPSLGIGREEGGAHFVILAKTAPVYTVDARLIRVIPEDPRDAKRYPLAEQINRDVKKNERDRR